MFKYEQVPTLDPEELVGPAINTLCPLLPLPQSASLPKINVSSDDCFLAAPPRIAPYMSPTTVEFSRRRKYSSTSTLASDFLSASTMMDPDFLTPPTPTFTPLRSPISSLWDDRGRQERTNSLPEFRGNVTYKDASVNTDCSMFYEGAPLIYQRSTAPLPAPLPAPFPAALPAPIPTRLSRPSSFIDNLNKIGSEDEYEGADPETPPPLPPTSELLNPKKEKSDGETPRAPSTGKRAKFLSALARVGIKPRRQFSPLVMDNSDSE